jgi:hypothetical protein
VSETTDAVWGQNSCLSPLLPPQYLSAARIRFLLKDVPLLLARSERYVLEAGATFWTATEGLAQPVGGICKSR